LAKLKNNPETLDVTSATVSYEGQLWQMAVALGDMLLPKLLSGKIRVAAPSNIKIKEVS